MAATKRSVNVGRLEILADKANREHNSAEGAAQQTMKHALEAGKLLLKAKGEVGHGDFTNWIEGNFDGSPRHARRYMSLATAVAANRIDFAKVTSLTQVEGLLRDQRTEQELQKHEPPKWTGEYEPEVEGEEYDFTPPDEKNKSKTAERENETAPSPQDVARKPARKRDLQTSAFSAVNRFIREVEGDEKDRIQAIREHLDMEEADLLAPASEEG